MTMLNDLMAITKGAEFTDHSNSYMQRIRIMFPNGYGASIIKGDGSYGVELAVITDEGLCYDTDITDDVIGNIENLEELINMHKKIGPDDYVIDAGANYDIISGTQRKWKLVIPKDVYIEDVIEDLKNFRFTFDGEDEDE